MSELVLVLVIVSGAGCGLAIGIRARIRRIRGFRASGREGFNEGRWRL